MIGLKGVWEVPQPVVSVLDPFCSELVEVVSCSVQSTEVFLSECLLRDVEKVAVLIDRVAVLIDPVAVLVDPVAALIDLMKTWISPMKASERPRESFEREHASLR